MSNILTQLTLIIDKHKNGDETKSYTAQLFKRGPEKCAEKFGEEAIEAIIAAVKNDKENLINETADVLFHLLIMLASRDVNIDDVLKELEERKGISGIIEKQNRKHISK